MTFKSLTEGEMIILSAFLELWLERNTKSITINKERDGFCFCKLEDDKWVSFYGAKGRKGNYHEFIDLMSLCMYQFSLLDEENRYYCITEFPDVLQNKMDNALSDSQKSL